MIDTTTVRMVLRPVPVEVMTNSTTIYWVVTGVIAMGSAVIGALTGGMMSLRVHERAVAAGRKAREEERSADVAERRARVRARLIRLLMRVIELPIPRVEDTTKNLNFEAMCVEVRLMWQTFERQSDDLHLLGTPEFQRAVEEFLAGLHAASAGLEALGAAAGQRMVLYAMSSMGMHPDNIRSKFSPIGARAEFIESFQTKQDEARKLLAQVEAEPGA